MTDQAVAGDPMRERILRATFKVLCRHGYGKLNLSDVATQAGISRPTFYKFFASKDELMSAFSQFELQLLREDLDRAIGGRVGRERVAALLQFLVDFYGSYQMRGLIEIEPGLVLGQMARALPTLVELIAPALAGQVSDPDVVAMALVRLAVCHYLVPGYDDDLLLDQLRIAAGVR
ncbi:MAG: TetR/AcrR family transcriptional regulator [Mycobacterium sp.]|uniref:TetR/AcrR family transcriptional regulator n=1 Tax=Mycobacterium sp. TaxID=1785 RepID=UPI003F9AD118